MTFSPSSPSSPSSPFARPRFKPRFQKPDKDAHRLNERIRVPEVRLIDADGSQVGVVPTREALRMAQEKGLDLMEVAPDARPPVCKICDYGKFKYEQKKKEQQAKKKQQVIKIKEVQVRPKTDEHDLEYKLRNAREFLSEGNKVKITMLFRGREITHKEVGMEIMKRVAKEMADVAMVESSAKMDGRKMIMILAPGTGGSAPKKQVILPKPIAPKKPEGSSTGSGSTGSGSTGEGSGTPSPIRPIKASPALS